MLGRLEIRKKYLTFEATAKAVGINRSTLYEWIKKGLFPAPVKIGRRSYYPKELVENFFHIAEKNGKVEPFWWEK